MLPSVVLASRRRTAGAAGKVLRRDKLRQADILPSHYTGTRVAS